MTANDLLLWYNVGYIGTFILGLVFLITSIIGMDSGDISADQDIEHDVEHDTEHEAHDNFEQAKSAVDLHGSFLQPIWNTLGIGRCPLSIIIMSFLFLFTFFGLSINIVLKTSLVSYPILGLLTYSSSLIIGFFLTGRLAGIIGKIMPATETYVKKESSLVGKIGKSVYEFTNNKGYVQVYDDLKNLKEISAINVNPQETIRANDDVLIVDYDVNDRIFKVKTAPKELTDVSFIEKL